MSANLEKKTSEKIIDRQIFYEMMRFDMHEHLREKVFEEISKYSYNIAIKMIKNHNEAQEIAQDVSVNVLRSRETYDPSRSGVTSWIYHITRNVVRDRIAKNGGKRRRVNFSEILDGNKYLESLVAPEEENREDSDLTISEKYIDRENKNEEALYLMHVRGLSQRETAFAQKRKIGTIKSGTDSAKKKIRERVESRKKIAA